MEKKESETTEFKKSTIQLKEAVISICAMLNKHKKGTVYFGIKDDGTVCGQTIGKKTTSDISQELRNNLKPLPLIDISVEEVDGKQIIVVNASGDDTPYSAYGRYYIRLDDSDTNMDSRMLWKYFESKEKTYSRWEEERTPYGIECINEEQLIQFIREANDIGRIDYVYRNPAEALRRFGMIDDDGFLNNAGHCLFGNDRPVLLKEVIYPTDERVDFTDLKQFRGNILECINEGIRYIQNNIHYAAEIVGVRRVETPEVPVRAIREIVINSFVHCRYLKGDCNEITITKSKIRIYNPGGIINDASPVDFASGKIGSKIRNPLIATALFKNGMIDAFGTGFDRTFKVCAENGVDYDYNNDEFGFTFIFKRKDRIRGSRVKEKLIDRKTEEIIRKRTRFDYDLVNSLKDNPYVTTSQLTEMFKKSSATIQRHLESLTEEGYIIRIGSRKSGYWKVIKVPETI